MVQRERRARPEVSFKNRTVGGLSASFGQHSDIGFSRVRRRVVPGASCLGAMVVLGGAERVRLWKGKGEAKRMKRNKQETSGRRSSLRCRLNEDRWLQDKAGRGAGENE